MRNPHSNRRFSRLLYKGLVVTNLVLAVLIFGAWRLVAHFFADAMSWATWHTMPDVLTWEQLASYPFVVLWSLPLVAAWTAWIANLSEKRRMAIGIALAPVLGLMTTFGWYYLTPTSWH